MITPGRKVFQNRTDQRLDSNSRKASGLRAEEAFAAVEDFGPQQIPDAIRLYKQQVLCVTKKATHQEAANTFIKYQEHERSNNRTVYSDRHALRDKLIPALGGANSNV